MLVMSPMYIDFFERVSILQLELELARETTSFNTYHSHPY